MRPLIYKVLLFDIISPSSPIGNYGRLEFSAFDWEWRGVYNRVSMDVDLEPAVLTVSEATRYIRDLLESDLLLRDLWIRGEVSNFSRSTAGHIYFTLKDEEASIRCVLWRYVAEEQAHLPADGQAFTLHGRVSVYEIQGAYQFYVDLVQPAGVGTLYLQFLALKDRLKREGLFAPERKRPIPPFPHTIGVVTSPQAAAWRDILHVLERRYPLAEVILAPTMVQGPEAPRGIAEAIRALNRETDVDLIIVARGGGSLEELWAFNEEVVVRAIYDSRVPVISGVGHEIDFTIADFVADLRAPTPTAAAVAAVPDAQEYEITLQRQREGLAESIQAQIAGEREDLRYAQEALLRLSPRTVLERYRLRVDDLGRQALSQVGQRIALQRERIRSRTLQLTSLNPQATLERGYSITKRVDSGVIVKSVAQVVRGDRIGVQVTDGQFEGTVD